MKGALALRGQTRTPIINECSSTTIAAATYLQLTATIGAPTSALQVQNTTAKVIKLAVGGAGSEVDKVAIAPNCSVEFPIELKKGDRLAAKASGADATTGALVVNFLQ